MMSRKWHILLAVITILFLILILSKVHGVQSKKDKNCSDFFSWAHADAEFKRKGGPENDPYYLDGDRDGIPCEKLFQISV